MRYRKDLNDFPAPEFSELSRAAAWVLYDLANTIYAASLTYVFVPFFGRTFGVRTPVGVTQTASMVLSGLAVPFLGAVADRTGNARRYLAISTMLTIACFAAMGMFKSMVPLLIALFLANAGYQIALVYYNALLPSAARPERVGLVSGLGVALGYFGNIVTLLLFVPLGKIVGPQGALVVFAALFLLFALPCMLLVSDKREGVKQTESVREVLRSAWTSLRRTLVGLPRHRALMFFLIGNFLLVDALNTAILYFGDVTKQLFEPAAAAGRLTLFGHVYKGEGALDTFLQHVGLILTVCAIIFGVVIGQWANRGSGLRPMRASAWCLAFALVGGAITGGKTAEGYVLTLVLFGAVGLAGIWTAGRKVLLVLAPPDQVGEYFGLYGITTKLSVIGSTVFGIVNDLFGPRIAMVSQAGFLVGGLVFLYLVRIAADAVGPGGVGQAEGASV